MANRSIFRPGCSSPLGLRVSGLKHGESLPNEGIESDASNVAPLMPSRWSSE